MKTETRDNYEYLLSVLDKAEKGPMVEQSRWDRNIYKSIKQLIEKYQIGWERDIAVPFDDSLADRLFEAGMELAVETGVYCLDTGRQMRWTREELEYALASEPMSQVLGLGEDAVTIGKRRPDDNLDIVVAGGPFGIEVPETLFIPVMLSYAKDPLIDFIDNASLITTYGRSIRAGSPWEAVGCWQEVGLSFEVLRIAGRQGLAIGCAENAPTLIGELASNTHQGFRPTDWHHVSFVSELKTTYSDLTKAIHYAHTNSVSHGFYNPIYGGFVGGVEGMAIACVAGFILMRACYCVPTSNVGPSHSHLSCDTHPDMIPAQALSFQAISRNTNLLIANFVRPVGGPCTPDILYEISALTVASIVSGISFTECVQSATGRFPLHATGLEAHFTAQVAHSSLGLTRKEANPIVKFLISKYAEKQKTIQAGKPFPEAYDVQTIKPTSEWQQIYEQVCQEIELKVALTF
jgi:methylamine--corrinoid protein Co-methyltransferase